MILNVHFVAVNRQIHQQLRDLEPNRGANEAILRHLLSDSLIVTIVVSQESGIQAKITCNCDYCEKLN